MSITASELQRLKDIETSYNTFKNATSGSNVTVQQQPSSSGVTSALIVEQGWTAVDILTCLIVTIVSAGFLFAGAFLLSGSAGFAAAVGIFIPFGALGFLFVAAEFWT